MSAEKKVIRFERDGPNGLEKMDLDQADFQSELPEQHLHVYYENDDIGLSLGVWTTTSMQEAFGPYPGDEFMWILEGQVAMLDADNNATMVKPGESFCIRNGIPISWKQEGFLRKYWMTYENPNGKVPKIESAKGGVKVLDPVTLTKGLVKKDNTDPFEISNGSPLQRGNVLFTNDEGNYLVGMWDTDAFESDMKPFPTYEFVQLLEGEITITEEDGTVNEFKAGDAFFVPKGTVCSWKVTGYVKKYFCVFKD